MVKHSLTLTGVLETPYEKVPLSLENFNFTEDMLLKSFGKDSWGKYDYHGKMMSDGRFYMYKNYPNTPAIKTKTLAGYVTAEGNLAGHAYEGKNPPNSVNVPPIGAFFIDTKFNQWIGYTAKSSVSSQIPLLLNLKAMQKGHLFGMGMKNGFVYLLVGSLKLDEGTVFMMEIWLPTGPNLRKTYTHYHGKFSAQGMRTIMTGTTELRYKNSLEMVDIQETGTFNLAFDAQAIRQQPLPQIPLMHQPMHQPVQQIPPNPYSMQYVQPQHIQSTMAMNYPQPTPYKPPNLEDKDYIPPMDEIELDVAPSKRGIKTVSFAKQEVGDEFDFGDD